MGHPSSQRGPEAAMSRPTNGGWQLSAASDRRATTSRVLGTAQGRRWPIARH
jgi:hypothetical protein